MEAFVRSVLSDVAERHGLYLDKHGERKARPSMKVTWQDGYGNKHDLDYVLERGGTDAVIGTPVAFIESAWRRYTKHSKNKVQEIEAAVMPVALTFSRHQPFCGAVVAGEFTRTALLQLESKGFAVLYIAYASILDAFAQLKIDASSADGISGTTEGAFRDKIARWGSLPQPASLEAILGCLHALHSESISDFKARLEASLSRRVITVRLTVLRGRTVECQDISEAITYLVEEEHSARVREDSQQREAFEIQVRFNTGSRIDATFGKRDEAVGFLRTFS